MDFLLDTTYTVSRPSLKLSPSEIASGGELPITDDKMIRILEKLADGGREVVYITAEELTH